LIYVCVYTNDILYFYFLFDRIDFIEKDKNGMFWKKPLGKFNSEFHIFYYQRSWKKTITDRAVENAFR